MTPRITVLVPTHNRAGFLREDFSVVVADNASEDDTVDLVSSFADPRIRYIRHAEDIGYVQNFNFCLGQLDAEYFTFLHDDDYMLPGRLEEILGLLEERPRVSLVHSAFTEVDGAGKVLVERNHWIHGIESDVIQSGHDFIRDRIGNPGGICFPTAVVRTSALPAIGFDAADYPAVDFGDVAFVARPLLAFRNHEGSESAAVGSFEDGRYVEGFEIVTRFKEVKLRFLYGEGARLPGRDRLLRDAERCFRRQLLGTTWGLTHADPSVRRTGRLLLEASRRDMRLLLELGTWRLLAGSIVKPALRRLRRARARGHSSAG
jgi:glycosyltransferase involved in cell wall biosynthesis